jgi:hypothetical protein
VVGGGRRRAGCHIRHRTGSPVGSRRRSSRISPRRGARSSRRTSRWRGYRSRRYCRSRAGLPRHRFRPGHRGQRGARPVREEPVEHHPGTLDPSRTARHRSSAVGPRIHRAEREASAHDWAPLSEEKSRMRRAVAPYCVIPFLLPPPKNPCPARAEKASQAGRRRFDPGRPLSSEGRRRPRVLWASTAESRRARFRGFRVAPSTSPTIWSRYRASTRASSADCPADVEWGSRRTFHAASRVSGFRDRLRARS